MKSLEVRSRPPDRVSRAGKSEVGRIPSWESLPRLSGGLGWVYWMSEPVICGVFGFPVTSFYPPLAPPEEGIFGNGTSEAINLWTYKKVQ